MFYITGFKPFKGRTRNGSETLVNALRGRPELRHINFRVLDVAWSAFDEFFQEVAGAEPAGIIGFGEGKEASIMIERIGHNISSGEDEFGVERESVPIAPDGAAINHSRLRVPKGRRGEVGESEDAGTFLCNYELFHINTLDVATSAFIHLPPQGDTADDLYVESLLPTIEEIVLHNFEVADADLVAK